VIERVMGKESEREERKRKREGRRETSEASRIGCTRTKSPSIAPTFPGSECFRSYKSGATSICSVAHLPHFFFLLPDEGAVNCNHRTVRILQLYSMYSYV